MSGHADPRVGDRQLLDRLSELQVRDSLSRVPDAAKAQMAAADCPPGDWAPLTAGEHLEQLQVQRWIEQRMSRRRTVVYRAREAGVGWAEISAVLDLSVVQARDEYAAWIDGQQQLHDEIGIGMDDDQAAAAWFLLEDDHKL